PNAILPGLEIRSPPPPVSTCHFVFPASQSALLRGKAGRQAVVRVPYHRFPRFRPQVPPDLDILPSAMQALVRLILLDASSPNIVATEQNSKQPHAAFYISHCRQAQVVDPLRDRKITGYCTCPSSETMMTSQAPPPKPGSSDWPPMLPIARLGFLSTGSTEWPMGDVANSAAPSGSLVGSP
ncbi:hypothetical protein CORC01_10980, partial [Colletotrichum orchidophilum]